MKMILRWGLVSALFLVVILWTVGAAVTVSAQEPVPDLENEVLRISKSLYCPVCTGVPLDVCETQACVQWRALIREKLEAGQGEEQIRQYFIAQYGERVLGAPPPEGFNLSAYILPVLVLLGGGAALFWTTRGWLRQPPPQGALSTVPQVPPEYAERIAQELEARE